MLPVRHVLLNALFLDPSASGGPETYLRGLALALRDVRPDVRLTVATTRRGAAALRADRWPERGIAVRELPCDDGERVRRQVAEQVMLPGAARRAEADVVHSLASVAPIRIKRVAHVITLHDVNFIHHTTFNPITTWGMRKVIPRAARRADALIAGTAASRDDVCRTLGLSPAAFTVVHHGAERAELVTPAAEADVRLRFGLDGARVVLCVGAKRPHKNQAVVVRALTKLPPDVRLVLVGHAEPYEAELRALTSDLGLTERVVFADWVSAADLEALWAMAGVAAFPTLAEGFGLPVLEALARGVPVACSDLAVLHEVGGPAPRFFDPADPADAARAINALLDARPEPGAARGWAARFTWAAAAEATWAVYEQAIARHERGGGSGGAESARALLGR